MPKISLLNMELCVKMKANMRFVYYHGMPEKEMYKYGPTIYFGRLRFRKNPLPL